MDVGSDDAGNVYFVTGNSDKAGTTYDGVTNIPESVVKASPNLNSVLSLFTPSDQASLDAGDTDYGSGGVVLLPTVPASPANSVAAAGKNGQLYMLNLSSLGGKSATGIGGTPVSIGHCWCAQLTFSDGTEHLVSSGDSTVMLWNIKPSPVSITQTATSAISEARRMGMMYGIVHKINGNKFTLEVRTGKTIQVDASSAAKSEKLVTLSEGLAVSAEGTLDKAVVMHAGMVNRMKSARAMRPEDR